MDARELCTLCTRLLQPVLDSEALARRMAAKMDVATGVATVVSLCLGKVAGGWQAGGPEEASSYTTSVAQVGTECVSMCTHPRGQGHSMHGGMVQSESIPQAVCPP